MAELLIRWVTPVTTRLQDVRDTLSELAQDPAENGLLPFAGLPMVHFASLTLFDQEAPPLLVFESNIDGPISAYVSELVKVGRAGLDALYLDSPGYPVPGDANSKVERFLETLKCRAQLYHIGHPNRSLQAIRGDSELRRSISRELDDPKLKGLSPAAIVRGIRVSPPGPFRGAAVAEAVASRLGEATVGDDSSSRGYSS